MSKSVFGQLTKHFHSLYQYVSCSSCERKIDLQSVCVECHSRFCAECLFKMRKTKMCVTCKATDSIKATQNRSDFVDDLVDLIKLFDQDTNQHIIMENFLAVEKAENLERIFSKEKSNVFNQQQFYATSTPSHNNAKKVNFQTDITMIPPSVKEANKQIVVESAEKVNPKNKKPATNEKSTASSASSSVAGKRKAESMVEKVESTSKTKKAKLATAEPEDPEEDENEIAKENLNEQNNEMDVEKQPAVAAGDKSVEKQPPQQTSRRNSQLKEPAVQTDHEISGKKSSTLQNKDLENRQVEENHKLHSEYKQLLEDRLLEFKQFEQRLQEERKQFEERLLEGRKQFEERTVQMLKEQMLEIAKLHGDSVQNGIVGLFKLFTESKSPVTSSIQLDKIGKVSYTIEPFVEVPKKVMRSAETQTETFRKPTGEFWVQTERPVLVDQSMNTETKRFVDANVQCEPMKPEPQTTSRTEKKTPVSCPPPPPAAPPVITQSQDEVRQVVNNVINKSVSECNGKPPGRVSNGQLHDEASSAIVQNKSNNLSIQFDETGGAKELNDKTADDELMDDDEIDSDEMKKPVDVSIIDSDDDEIIASSPIYE